MIARNTAFTYKGKSVDAKTIGKELGVRYMLEGSIQPSGTQVRVNAQLIDTNNGAHLWVDQFDANRADLLQMQDQIVRRLASTLRTELMDVEARRIERSSTANTDANDLAWRCRLDREKCRMDRQAGLKQVTPFASKRSSPTPTILSSCGPYRMKFYFRPRSAAASIQKRTSSVATNFSCEQCFDPDNGTGHFYKATILNAQGRFDEAIAEGERALALDPALASAFFALSDAYRFQGQFEKEPRVHRQGNSNQSPR